VRPGSADIDGFLRDLREGVVGRAPTLGRHFDLYADEARFGWSLIAAEVARLPPGAEILEIGAGAMLLSGYLASRGRTVTALEPIEIGFPHFREFQRAVIAELDAMAVRFRLVERPIERYAIVGRFDYAFAVNVFEHVADVDGGLANAIGVLRPGGQLRIYCANYTFPYEPHFHIPTVWNKRLTGRIFGRVIARSTVADPWGSWEGLNWITWRRVRRVCRALGATPIANRDATYHIIRRLLDDPEFRRRHPRWISRVLAAVDRVGLTRLARHVPAAWAPVMDFRVVRPVTS
jgi:SAM-dependent methyltransferase